MTCTAHLNGGVLACIRTDAHTTGHVYAASEAPDRHALTEPNGRNRPPPRLSLRSPLPAS